MIEEKENQWKNVNFYWRSFLFYDKIGEYKEERWESHLVRIINRWRRWQRFVTWNVLFERRCCRWSSLQIINEEEGSTFTLRDVEARETYALDSIDLT